MKTNTLSNKGLFKIAAAAAVSAVSALTATALVSSPAQSNDHAAARRFYQSAQSRYIVRLSSSANLGDQSFFKV